MDSKANIFEIYYSAHHKCIESCNQYHCQDTDQFHAPHTNPSFSSFVLIELYPKSNPFVTLMREIILFVCLFHMSYTWSHITIALWVWLFFFKILFIYLFLDRGERREKERERNMNVWLPLACLLVGTWPATQACALTGNWTGTSWLPVPCSVHWATPAKVESGFLKLAK